MPNNQNSTNLAGDILIVDDETPNLQLLSQVLSGAGYQSLRSIKRPQSAIDSALALPPSLILLDVRMPEMDGFEVCRRLKQDDRTRDIPVIFVSALQDVNDRIRGFKVGGVDFISKPFQESEVLARVRTHLSLRNMQLHLEDLVAKRTAELTVTNKTLEAEIGERKKAEAELWRNRNYLNNITNSMGDAVFSVKLPERRIEWVNNTTFDILGYDRDELLGRTTEFLYPDRNEFMDFGNKLTGAVAEGRDIIQIEQVLRRKSGEDFPVEITVTINKDKGEVVGAIGIVRDVTDRRRATLELKQAYDEIRKLKDSLEAENLTLRQEVKMSYKDNEIIGQSHVFQTVLRQVEHVAPTDSTVLILGETGTGKGLIARRIHELSGRQDRPIVNVNCAALPANLIESEFFGHEKGAFTGAIDRKIGRFELADGGTIFLDEIGDLPIELQAKLLRVLQDQEFERIGSSTTRTVDTRIIAATNRDLDGLIEQGAFRADLYYRLGVFPIRIPPLRERRGDISLLVWFFIAMLKSRLGKEIKSVSAPVMEALTSYDWPGNVRELRNIVERAMILSPGTTLEMEDSLTGSDRIAGESAPAVQQPTDNLEDAQRTHIVRVLEECGWKVRGKGGAAERLGLKRTTLQSRMKKLGIQRPAS